MHSKNGVLVQYASRRLIKYTNIRHVYVHVSKLR